MGQAGGDRKWLLLTWGCAAVARVCGCTPKLLAPLGTRPRLAPMLGCNRLQFNPSDPAAATPLSPSLGRARAHFGYFGQGREQGRELLQLGVLGQPESPSVEPSREGSRTPLAAQRPAGRCPTLFGHRPCHLGGLGSGGGAAPFGPLAGLWEALGLRHGWGSPAAHNGLLSARCPGTRRHPSFPVT